MRSRSHYRRMRHGRAFAAASLCGVVALAVASPLAAGATSGGKLTAAERAFARSYDALVPSLNRASAAIVTAVRGAGKDTDAQVVTVFTALAKQWASVTRPLLALTAPGPEAAPFAAVTSRVAPVEADLLAAAQSGRTHNGSAATAAGKKLVLDFNALGVAVQVLKKRFGLA